jgi:hypothetical protein
VVAAVTDAQPLPHARELELLAHARRLDWRFLLPRYELGRVAYLGDEDPALVEALRASSARLDRLAITAAGRYDVVVLRNPGRKQLGLAPGLVGFGGAVYVEFDRSAVRRLVGLWRVRRARRLLERSGFGDVSVHWHWPSAGRCTQIVPLAAPRLVTYALDQRPTRRSASLRTFRDRVLGRLRLLPTLARSVSLVAERGGGDSTPAVTRAARELVSRGALERSGLAAGADTLLLTPRFRTSRHAVALLFPRADARPRLVAKVPRLPGDNEAVATEALVLAELADRGAPARSVPAVVGFGDVGDRSLLVQSALAGTLLTAAELRSDLDGRLPDVLTWLEQLARATGTTDGVTVWQNSIALPLDAFAAASPRGGEEQALVERTLELTRPLIGAPIRLGVQHGDLSHPNLIVLDDGGLGVVDWELAELHGLPLQDASYFLAYAVFARARARGVSEELDAFDRAFVRPGGWAARELGAFARRTGVPEELVTPLFVACWARAAASMRDRVPSGVADETDRWIRESRYYVLWRHALDHATDLSWDA